MTPARTRRWIAAGLVVGGLLTLSLVYGTRRSAKAEGGGRAPEKSAGAKGKQKGSRAAAKGETAPPRGPVAERPSPKEVVVRAGWGQGAGQLGRKAGSESAPQAPMGFAIDAEGRIHVLDQVNTRIQIFEKDRPPRVVPLPADTFQDIALDAKGNAVVLDRLATGTLAFVGANGEVDHTVPITGPGVPEGGGVTGMFVRPDGVWLEVEHGTLVRVALANGEPDPARPSVRGRFSFDGTSVIRAAVAGPTAVAVTAEPLAKGGSSFEATVMFPSRVFGLHALECDARGRTYLVANLVREREGAPFDIVEEREIVVVLDKGGAEIGRVPIAPPEGPEEQFRPIRVGDDGSIYQLVAGRDGATLERFTL